jgi:curved DNA-binding protein CbpA
MRNYYEVLGVPQHAGPQEIRQAFRRLARRFHPDAGPEGSGERFQEVSEAYRTLSDPERRRSYDRALHETAVARRTQYAAAAPSGFRPWAYRPPGPGCLKGLGMGGEIVLRAGFERTIVFSWRGW